MMADLLCMGEPLAEFNALPVDAEGRTLFLAGHGGDTSNVAIAAARQGAKSGFLGAVGLDAPGDSLMALWQREQVATDTVWRDPAAPTGVYFVTHDAAGHHFLHYRKGSAASRFGAEAVAERGAAIRAARMLFASGISLGISEVAADGVLAAFALAREAGVKIGFDTNYRPKLWPPARAAAMMHAAMASADYVFPGLEDAATLTGLTDPDAIVDFYLRLGPAVVVLKMGAEGAILADAAGRIRIPSYRVAAVDATGAGDTFCGAFLARILAGDAPAEAARYAVIAAALKCHAHGAVAPIPRAAEVQAVLAAQS
ncbi:MAG: sugar kinase [Rhodospirillales bacterium]|nr:sugar kinase [Rhodospirillales bacterium]